MNNNFLGMVRQWQEFFFEKRYSAVNMRTPDFVKLAEAHGVPARRVTSRDEVDDAIEWARKTPDPWFEFKVEQEDAVYPMVPAGARYEMLQTGKAIITSLPAPCNRHACEEGAFPDDPCHKVVSNLISQNKRLLRAKIKSAPQMTKEK